MSRIRTASEESFWKSKLKMSLDYIFGKGTSKKIEFSNLAFEFSNRTGRLKQITQKGTGYVLFSFRPNGSIAPTVKGAGYLWEWSGHKSTKRVAVKSRPRWVVTVIDGVTELVSQGKTVFCKHVAYCDDSLRAEEDVVVMNVKGEIIAVGRSTVSGPLMKQFKRGVAIKVREGVSQKKE
jgi:conserved protein with predicted RNA binding PUA domain